MNAREAKFNREIAENGAANCAVAYVARLQADKAPPRSALRSTWRHVQKEFESLTRDAANALAFDKGTK